MIRNSLPVILCLVFHAQAGVGFVVGPASKFQQDARLAYSSNRATRASNLRMGFFDAIGKALQESMANDETLGAKSNPGFRV